MAGRRAKRSPEREQAILNALKVGNTRRASAGAAGISHELFYQWINADLAFLDAVEKAEAEAEQRFLGQVAVAAAGGTWTAAAWWLERRKYQDYGRRDKVEMSIDLRRETERIAAEMGLDPVEVLAEAEAIMRSAK